MKKRTIALLMAVVMLFGATVGGTIAYLQAQSNQVVNTFVAGNIALEMKEHDYDVTTNSLLDTEVVSEDTYKLIPGTTMPKDPFVRVKAKSEKCWVFVKITEANNTLDGERIVDFTVDLANWTPIAEGSNIYYYKTPIEYSDADSANLYVFEGNTSFENGYVTVNTELKVGDVTDTTKPSITLEAYAVQYATFESDAVAAWTSTFGAPTNP